MRSLVQSKILRKARAVLIPIILAFGWFLLKEAWGLEGAKNKFIAVLGVLVLIKSLFFLKKKAFEEILDWFSKQSLLLFRGFSLIKMAVGLYLAKGINILALVQQFFQ